MQIVSIFKRADFAMDIIFMCELYSLSQCRSSEVDAFIGAHFYMDAKTGLLLFCLLYFPRAIVVLLAAIPRNCNCEFYKVPNAEGFVHSPTGSDVMSTSRQMSHSWSTATTKFYTSESAMTKTPSLDQKLDTTLQKNNRFAFLLLAEVGGMASVTLPDLKYSEKLSNYLSEHGCNKSAALWFRLQDVRIQIKRGSVAIGLTGLFENGLHVNCQVLLLSMMRAYHNPRNRDLNALWTSIVSSFFICILKLRQTLQVIRFAYKKCKDLQDEAVDMGEPFDHAKFQIALKHTRWWLLGLVLWTLSFVLSFAWAALVLILIHHCRHSMWHLEGCVDQQKLGV